MCSIARVIHVFAVAEVTFVSCSYQRNFLMMTWMMRAKKSFLIMVLGQVLPLDRRESKVRDLFTNLL